MYSFVAALFALLSLNAVPIRAAAPALEVRTAQLAESSIPTGAQRVSMLRVSLHASCDAEVVLRGITVHHHGLGAASDILRIYALLNGNRMTRGYAFDSALNTATLDLRARRIPACGFLDVIIAADFSSNAAAAGQHGISIDQASDIAAGGARIQAFLGSPVSRAQTIGPETGTVTAVMLPLLQKVSYGGGRTVARMRLRADSENDQEITSVTVTNDGSARDLDLQQLFVESSDGTRLSSVVEKMDGDRVHFVFPVSFVLMRNQEKLVVIKADVRGRARKTIKLVIEEPSDIAARALRSRRAE
jgi:hypothetical protein